MNTCLEGKMMLYLRREVLKRFCGPTIVIFTLLVVWTIVQTFLEYRWDGYLYTLRILGGHYRVFELPSRNEGYFNTRRVDYDGWTPGNPKWLVDMKGLQSKLPNNVTENGYHEILYYAPRPADMLARENRLFDTCLYRNCHLTDDMSKYGNSSAVIFELSHHYPKNVPSNRPRDQIWLFQDEEASCSNKELYYRHRRWDNKFNWSMTIRYDSDIIRAHGFLKTRRPEEIPRVDYHEVFTRKTKFAAWIVSHCGPTNSYRQQYVQELQQYIPVDIYGKCGTLSLSKSRDNVRKILNEYKFYLGFENSFCVDYITEKFFQYFNTTDAVLVVRGGADYDQLFPEYTHINTNHFVNARDLATYLLALNQSESEYTKYLRTRDKYQYTASDWACTLCIKLNNKQKYAKVYHHIVSWWNTNKCWAAPDVIIPWWRGYEHIFAVVFFICVGIVACSKAGRLKPVMGSSPA